MVWGPRDARIFQSLNHIVTGVPLGPSGKILKRELVAEFDRP